MHCTMRSAARTGQKGGGRLLTRANGIFSQLVLVFWKRHSMVTEVSGVMVSGVIARMRRC